MSASAHARSIREYPERMPDPEYPLHWERCRVRRDGSLNFQGRQPHLSEALAGEAVGLVEVEEELWQSWFCDYKVAVLDAPKGSSGASAPLDAARRPSKLPWKLLKCQQLARSNTGGTAKWGRELEVAGEVRGGGGLR